VLVLLSVSIITFGQRGGGAIASGVKSLAHDIVSPIANGVNDILRPIGDFFAGAFHYGALAQENEKLQASIGRLRMQQASVASQQRQLAQITALQHLPYIGSLPTVTAQVQGAYVSNFAATVTIDKGRNAGVALGMPVVGYGGLVGQVVEADKSSSVIRLVTDGQTKVGVTYGPAGAFATVTGEGPRVALAAQFVDPAATIHKGELMTTNGQDASEFPKGIPVGRVTSFSVVPGASQMSVALAPAADLSNISYVDVVLWDVVLWDTSP